MKKSILLLIATLIAGGISAQILPEGVTSLLPEGVQINVDVEAKGSKRKAMVVTGSKEKGYKAFFAAKDAIHGEELWVTDGTVAGTKMVKDIWEGESTSDVNYMVRFNDKVVFAANDGTNGSELWISDGTEQGTKMVADIHMLASSDPRGFTQLNETQFIFIAKDFESEIHSDRGAQWWLYVSDGTEAGTKMIADCDARFPGSSYATTWVTPYCRVGRKVFFKADHKDGMYGEELWVTDGTTEGTRMIKDLNTEELITTGGTAGSNVDQMVNFYNEKLFFKAWTVEYGAEPWATDGTEEGTYLIKDTDPTFDANGNARGGQVSCPGVYPYNGKVYYRGYSPEYGNELACTNLEPGDYKVFDINTNAPTATNSGVPDPGVEFDGVFMFGANSGADSSIPTNYGGEQHYTDGETVKLQWDIAPGILHHWVKNPVVASGSLYWWNAGGAVIETKEKLFRLDSKTSEPVRVTNFNPNGDKVHSLLNLNGDLLFATSDESKALYIYHYRKPNFDPLTETDNYDRDLEFRTRDEISGIETILQDPKSAVIYPNPASEKFNFTVEGEVLNVKIYDLVGRLVKVDSKLATNSVDISILTKGIYNVLITSTAGSFSSRIIIE